MSDVDKLLRRSDETGMRITDVNVQAQIDRYIEAQDPPKRDDIEAIQRLILAASPIANVRGSRRQSGYFARCAVLRVPASSKTLMRVMTQSKTP
jgi:hypothetical protein